MVLDYMRLYDIAFLIVSLHQDQKILVENSNTYTLNDMSRDAVGEYKCSLADNEKMEASQNIVVSCEYSWLIEP